MYVLKHGLKVPSYVYIAVASMHSVVPATESFCEKIHAHFVMYSGLSCTSSSCTVVVNPQKPASINMQI